MTEPEVLRRVHQYLLSENIAGLPVVRLYTDAHATLTKHHDLAPFQRFVIDFGDFATHPDLVAQLGDGESLLAVEGKGETDLLSGLFQAELYQAGVQLAFLAAASNGIGSSLLEAARRRSVGVLSVGDEVEPLYVPEPRFPMQKHYRFLLRQIESVVYVTEEGTFSYNLPTHYLVWPIVLDSRMPFEIDSLAQRLEGYSLPKETVAVLGGAQKLGLVAIEGRRVHLTDVGRAVKQLLPTDVAEWSRIHSRISNRGAERTLNDEHRAAAAALRLLLFQDLIVRILVERLRHFPDRRANFAGLAVKCDQFDHAGAPIFFLKLESARRLGDEKGRISWDEVQADDYRSTTFYQYKSLLKHAGILAHGKLGGASAKGYDPTQDVWALSAEL